MIRNLIVRHHLAATQTITRRLAAVPAFLVAMAILGYGVVYGHAFSIQAAAPSNADKIAFVLGNYLQLDTLAPAPTGNELASVALSGENVGGVAQPANPSVIQYAVQPGESLSGIAAAHNLKQVSIVDKNPSLMDSTVLHVGQLLTLPSQDLDAADAAAVQAQWNAAKKKTLAATRAATPSSVPAAAEGYIEPITYRYISQGFSIVHTGLDMVADIGTPVYAVGDGSISIATTGWNGGYGTFIMLDMGNGMEARYAHLSAFADGIAPGTAVSQGQLIGFSGNTGNSTGPHLHFEIRVNGTPVNPAHYLP